MASRIFSVLVLTLFTASTLFSQSAEAFSGKPEDVRLTLSDNPKTTQTIGWRTDSTVTIGRIQYAKSGKPFSTVTAPAPEILSSNIGKIHLFTVTLRGLQPGTRYDYRVGDGRTWSRSYSFETEQSRAGQFEFLIFGDSHEKKPDYGVWRSTASRAYQDNPRAKFFVSLGDLIYSGRDYTQWQAWFKACRDVIATISVFPVIGDHEPRGVTSKDLWQRPEYFVKLLTTPQNGPEGLKGEVYSFDYGSAHLVVLNSSFSYEFAAEQERQDMISAETKWLDADLAATKQPWKFVIFHDATYNLSPDRSGTLTKQYFGPIIDKHRVDIVFNGHDHAMARTYAIRNEEYVSSATEGTVYFVSGRSGNNAKDALGRKIWHPFFYDPQVQTCYLVVSVSPEELAVKTRLQDGTIVDDFRINKRSPSQSTPIVPFGAYQTTRFAPFGTLLQSGIPPQQNKDGEWFVDIHALACYLSGSYNPTTNVLAYKDDEIKLQLTDPMFLDTSKKLVSLSGLSSVGFYCRYHKAMNLITVERWRD